MWEWLTDWSIGKAVWFVIGLIFFKPFLTMGYWIADGIGCHKTLNDLVKVTNMPLTNLPEKFSEIVAKVSWGRTKGFVIAPIVIIILVVLEFLFVGWLLALAGLGAVAMGLIGYDWSQLDRKIA